MSEPLIDEYPIIRRLIGCGMIVSLFIPFWYLWCVIPSNAGMTVTSFSNCQYEASTELTCDDGCDNDRDGLVDGADSDCASGDTCTGTDLFSWHMENVDVTTGTPAGCSQGDTTATLSGAAISNTQYYDGGNSLYINGAYDTAEFTPTGLFDTTNFKVDFRLYVSTFAADSSVFRVRVDASNYFIITMTGSSADIRMVATFVGTGASDSVTIASSSGRAEGAWFYVEVIGRQGVAGNDFKITVADSDGSSNPVSNEIDGDLAAWTGSFANFFVGNTTGNGLVAYIDNIHVGSSSGY